MYEKVEKEDTELLKKHGKLAREFVDIDAFDRIYRVAICRLIEHIKKKMSNKYEN